jgi:NAD(P)H-dependent FMN reductase
MLSHALKSAGPVVIPMEVFQSVNGFVAREANRFAPPFVSIENAPAAVTGNMSRPLFVPIIVDAAGPNHVGAKIAQCVMAKLAQYAGVEVRLLEAPTLSSAALQQADAMILVLPEYNYGFPNVLKNLLEKNPSAYAHRAVGICDLSPGWFGGSRLLETLLPLMRQSGLTPLFWDENSAHGEDIFGAAGQFKDHVQCERVDNFLQELMWMATALRQRREIGMPN